MTFLLKDPDAVLDYSINWGAEYLSEDQLANSVWSVSPDEPGGMAVASSEFDEAVSVVKVAGGSAGKIYRLINHVTMASGRVDSRSIVLRVEKR